MSFTPRQILDRCGFTADECDALEAHLRTQSCGEYTQNIECAFYVAEGIYWWGSYWHSGQFSRGYRAQCGTEFTPGAGSRGIDDEESPMARVVYDWLSENIDG